MKLLPIFLISSLLTACLGTTNTNTQGLFANNTSDIGSHVLINEYLDGDTADHISNMGALFVIVSGSVEDPDSLNFDKQERDSAHLHAAWQKKANKACTYGIKEIVARRTLRRQINTNLTIEGLVTCNDSENAVTRRGTFF